MRGLAGPGTRVVTSGRALYRALSARPAGQPAVVVPMTLGREPGLVAETARTVRALPAGPRGGVAVAEAFGTATHLTGWLRTAAHTRPDDTALLLAAPAGDPFEDAELYRVAHLVRRHGHHRLVEVALIGGEPGLAEGVRRCAALGARTVTVLAASLVEPVPPPAPPGVRVLGAGPLLGPAAIDAVLGARVATALHLLREHGDDGVRRALAAAEGHGLGHAHGPGADHHHGPEDPHDSGGGPHHGSSHAPAHGHPHAPAHGHEPVGQPAPERRAPTPYPHREPSPEARPAFLAGTRSSP
nr:MULTISPECIES: cobalamin biosynthesis protein CbiX [unclassified Streptomyces]